MLVVPMEITFKVDSNIILKLFKISVFRNEATNLVGVDRLRERYVGSMVLID